MSTGTEWTPEERALVARRRVVVDRRAYLDVPADGACLFRAFAFGLTNDPAFARERLTPEARAVLQSLRDRAADWQARHWADVHEQALAVADEPWLRGACADTASARCMRRYTRGMRQPRRWGGHFELVALARVYGRTVVVRGDGFSKPLVIAGSERRRPVSLYYAGGAHYLARLA